MFLCIYVFIHFWIDTHNQTQNTQIGIDTGIQIYNDIERLRAVEITIYDCRYSATAGFVKIDLRVAPAWWPSCRTSSTTARWPGDVTRCDQWRRFSVAKSRVAFHRCFTGCFWFQGAAGRNEKIKARSRRLRLCHRWVTLPSQKHAILTGPGADLERHQEGAKWYEVIWNDPANTQKCNKKMKREVKVTTKKSKVTKTRLASNYM